MLDRSKAPQIKPFGKLVIPDEHVMTLSNGLVLHTLSGGDQDVARLTVIMEGGSSDSHNPCIPAFAAELMREGNSDLDSSAIADLVDYNGAWLDSSATGHFTSVRISALASRMPYILPAVISCIAGPAFPAHAFEIIRQKAVARQRLNISRVSFLASADNKRLICGSSHPDGHLLSPEEIEAISRDDIVAFHERCLDAAHTHAYLCGRLTADLVDIVADCLLTLPSRHMASPVSIMPYCAEAPALSLVDKAGSLQSAVVMSLPAIPRTHPDYNALRMAVTALGGYFGSRLMLNIREDKGYTYGISASLIGAQEGGYISISAQCDNRYTDALISEVKDELRRMQDCPLSDAELGRLRFNVASDLASTLDSPFTMMDYYELVRTVGIPYDYFDARGRILVSVDADAICELSRRYLDPEALRISVAGDLNVCGIDV